MGTSIWKIPPFNWPMEMPVRNFLDWWRRPSSLWLVPFLGWLSWTLSQSRLSKPWRASQTLAHLHDLCFRSHHQAPALTSFDEGLWLEVEWNPFLPKLLLFMMLHHSNKNPNTVSGEKKIGKIGCTFYTKRKQSNTTLETSKIAAGLVKWLSV